MENPREVSHIQWMESPREGWSEALLSGYTPPIETDRINKAFLIEEQLRYGTPLSSCEYAWAPVALFTSIGSGKHEVEDATHVAVYALYQERGEKSK